MAHLLVTNDFPPKIGGIQSYLWELWRRLPPESTFVFTTPYANTSAFDHASPIPIIRSRPPVLLPTRSMARRIESLARELHVDLLVFDPALPIGALAPHLAERGLPYAVVLHGAEVTVPGRLPVARTALAKVLNGATHVIAAGTYPLSEGERAARRPLPATVIPPGVDTEVFRPADSDERRRLRLELGLPSPETGTFVLSGSRLVPRKGMDVLIDATAMLHKEQRPITLVISGDGRDRGRLERRANGHRKNLANLDVRFLGRVPHDQLLSLYRSADIYAMLCRNRWAGLEQEGFGIVFLEAAASGVAQVAGASGGSHDAVLHGETGLIVEQPTSVVDVANALRRLIDDPSERARMGANARRRACSEFTYTGLAETLHATLQQVEASVRVS